jgi:hypothetical protein
MCGYPDEAGAGFVPGTQQLDTRALSIGREAPISGRGPIRVSENSSNPKLRRPEENEMELTTLKVEIEGNKEWKNRGY